MRFNELESADENREYIRKYIEKNLLGKCSSPEHEKIFSGLVQKLKQQPVLLDFSEIEKRIINILFLKIFSENEECYVVLEKLIESLKNMRKCLELLAIYAHNVNSSLTDKIMIKHYPELRNKHYQLQEYTKRYIPSCALNRDEFERDLEFIVEDLKKFLDDKSEPFFREIEDMNCVIEQVQESIQLIKSLNSEQLLEMIFSDSDKLFPDFKSKIRELYTRWSIIQDKLLKFVEFEFSEHESDVDDDEEERFEQRYGSSENQTDWENFKLYNSGHDDDKANFDSALELVRRNIHR